MSLDGGCGLVTGVGAGTFDIVESQISHFTEKGDEAYQTALDALQMISQSFTQNISTIDSASLNPSVNSGSLPEYMRPQPEPDVPDLTWKDTDAPTEPPTIDADFSDYFFEIPRPTFQGKSPELKFIGVPSRNLPNPPNEPDPFKAPTYPDKPTIELPQIVSPINIVLPTLDPPDISGIQATIAGLRDNLPEAPSLPQDIGFTDIVNQFFSSAKLQISDTVLGLVEKINTLLSGGTGIPNDVALAMRNRAYFIEDRMAYQAEQTAIADWLARGFTLPGGSLEVKLTEIRQKSVDKKSELNLNLWIEEAKLEIENMRFAVQQGITYEAMHKDALIKLYGVCGDLAAKAADVQIKLLDAAVNVFQAKGQMWQIQFSTINSEIQLELSNIEVYKAQLEGQKLISDLNQQEVELYKTQIESVNSRVSLYKAEVEATNALLQGELGKLQYAAERVKLYATEISAWEAEWKAYGESVRAEQGKVEIYKALVQGFSSEVEAYAKNIDAAKTEASLQLETLQLGLQTWTAQLEKYKAEVQAESVRLGAASDVYRNQMQGYALKHEAEKAYIGTELQKLDYLLNVDKFNADKTIKQADLEQTKMLQLTKIAQDSLDAVARTAAQLAGSAMSAMNVGASVSSGSSFSSGNSCSETYTYEG